MSHVPIFDSNAIGNEREKRKVVYDGLYTEVHQDSLVPGEDIPYEIHRTQTQTIFVLLGTLQLFYKYGDKEIDRYIEKDGYFVIPNNTYHRLVNPTDTLTQFLNVYSGPKNGFIF